MSALATEHPYGYMNVKEGEKYDPMTIESESAYNKYLGFYFGKGIGKQIGYVYINIGATHKDKNDTNKIEIDRVGIMPWHIGEGWCKPLVIYALKRSIKELSNKFWTKNEET